MSYLNITSDEQLQQFCAGLAGCAWIGFDTEFVSEHTFRPKLCLIQVSAAGRLAVIDPLGIGYRLQIQVEETANAAHDR